MSERLCLSSEAAVRSMQYYVAGFHGGLCLLFTIGAMQNGSGVGGWPVLFAGVALAGPFYIRWRYVAPVWLSAFGVEAPEARVPWSAVRRIRISSAIRPACIITYEAEHGRRVERISGLALPSEALPSQVLIRWQRAVGREAVEKRWTLGRGHIIERSDAASEPK